MLHCKTNNFNFCEEQIPINDKKQKSDFLKWVYFKNLYSFNLIKKYCHEMSNYTAIEINPQI